MLPLPTPERGGTLDGLRCYVNVRDEEWPLFRAALTSYVLPRGPYPILIFSGEQESAKTTTCEVTRSMVDPHVSPLRSPPKEEHDLLITAVNAGVVGIDNVFFMPPWLSDDLCRIASGGGLSTRALYTDDAEVNFCVQKPIVVNGIEDVAARGDLLDRVLLFGLPAIPEGRRRTEADFRRDFDEAHPRLLGALLDVVGGGLAALPETLVPGLPRMADFARWGEAVSRALGDEPGAFLAAYRTIRAVASEIALEGSLVASTVRTFMVSRGRPWTGPAAALLEALGNEAETGSHGSAGWPKSPRGLAVALRRATPGLRAVGISVVFDRNASARNITLTPPT